jgi:hypothetical protein
MVAEGSERRKQRSEYGNCARFIVDEFQSLARNRNLLAATLAEINVKVGQGAVAAHKN